MERPQSLSIPVTPGVYLYKDGGGRIIYVGKARNLRKRVLSYFRPDDQLTSKTRAMLQHAVSIEFLSTTTEKEALLLEASLIKKHRPHYNIVLRDDKQYVLFRLPLRQGFPRLEIVRKVKKRDGARYFGPFTSGLAAKETWKSIHRVFPLRRCSDRAFHNRVRPCLYHHMGQCLAPCANLVSKEEYGELTRRVELLLSGKSRELMDMLQRGMEEAAEHLEFEKAAMLRDQIKSVEKTLERQGVVLPGGGEMDVLGVATRPDGLALGLLFVRDGLVIDRSVFFWPGLGLEEADELLVSFISQFYGPQRAVPPRLLLPWLPSEAEEYVEEEPAQKPDATEGEGANSALQSMEEALAELRGGPVRLGLARNQEERQLVDMAKSNARESVRGKADIPLGERLALVLHSRNPVTRIECVDVSHTSGVATKVGMVVFEDGKPLKSDYRVWNVEAGGDDYAALSIWAARRLEHGPPWPHLLLVDGGKGQLTAVERVLRAGFAGEKFTGADFLCPPPDNESEKEVALALPSRMAEDFLAPMSHQAAATFLPFVLAGIAKARDDQGKADRRAGNLADRIFVPGRSNPLSIREGSAELLFLQMVRDTTHDFAIGRHRQARARQAFNGELQRLPGVGPRTAKLLWEQFDSLEAMKAATVEEVTALPGIGAARGKKLWETLRNL